MLSVSSQIINQTLSALKADGFETDALCDRVGLDTSQIKDPDARFDIALENKLWEAIREAGAPAHVGLLIGERFQPNFISTVAYVMMYAPTLAIALKKCGLYQELLCDATRMHLDEAKGEWQIEFVGPWNDAYRYLVDKLMMIFAVSFRMLSCEDVSPLAIHFPYPEPQNMEPYLARFPSTELHFGSSKTSLLYRPSDLQLAIPFADPKLHTIFDQHAQELMEKMGKGGDLRQQVNQLLIELIRAETPSLDTVADRLAMSPRNLQLKLREAGTSYQQLLDDMRKEMALSYLRKGGLSKSDIAYMLGFSGLSTFSHSFKKWTGLSPSGWLQQAQSA